MTYRIHDSVLRDLAGAGPEVGHGAPNHAPMVVEALAALGRGDQAPAWVAAHRHRLSPLPRTEVQIGDDWTSALGDPERVGAWRTYFRREVADLSWRGTLERWLPRLIAGGMASGTHGLIRCGHAVRALQDQPTLARRQELADALAYCAARHRVMFEAPVLSGELDVEAAVQGLPQLAPAAERNGPPPKVVERLSERADFQEAVNSLAPPKDPSAALHALARVGARLYLAGSDRRPLVLLHAVTGPAAVQLILPQVSAPTGALAFAYIWQGVAAWVSAFGDGLPDEEVAGPSCAWDELVDRAVATSDAHAIKFTEACLRLDRVHSADVFRAAALDWVERIETSRSWTEIQLRAAGIRT